MATRSRLDKKGPKLGEIKMVGAFSPERFHYCTKHDTKMKPIRIWGSKRIAYECADGCRLSKNQTNLK